MGKIWDVVQDQMVALMRFLLSTNVCIFFAAGATSSLKSRVVRCLPFFFLSVAVYDRMRADQKKFGKAAWAAAVERMEKLQYAVSKETLQLMRAKEICLEQKKHALKEEVSFHASK